MDKSLDMATDPVGGWRLRQASPSKETWKNGVSTKIADASALRVTSKLFHLQPNRDIKGRS